MTKLTALVAAAAIAAGAAPIGADSKTSLVITFRHATFGRVLARPDGQALYHWNREKRDFKIHCTGACAKAWPPLIVRAGARVPRRIAGIRGTFGPPSYVIPENVDDAHH